MSNKLTIDYIREKIEAEGYSLVSTEYRNNATKLHTRCPNGHDYYVSWSVFNRGCRCTDPMCNNGKLLHTTIDHIREKIEAEGYCLISTEYSNCATKLHTRCPNGHDYYVSWDKFKSGTRCSEAICRRDNPKKHSLQYVKGYFEEQGYKLLSTEYKGSIINLVAECPQGHQHCVSYSNFRRGVRCPKCQHHQSGAELEIASFFTDLVFLEQDREQIGPKELDLYFPNHKVAIEYCGLYWHSDGAPSPKSSSYHRDKLDQCNAKGIRLLTIFEDEWLNNKDICISRINNALGISSTKIYGRKCIVRQIDKKQAKQFLNKTHLQGYGACKIAYGLFYEGQLVQVMTFGNPARAHTAKNKNVLEMKRLAGALDAVVIGGAGKLFKVGLQYAKNNGYDLIKSYCDLRWGTGNLYKQLGFIKTYETRYTPHYTDGNQNRWRNQSLAQNKKQTGKTETQAAQKRRLYKIYDCGHSTWEYDTKCE